MEGNVEGMVAIVRGMRDAGLAVTVMGRQRAGLSINEPDHLPPAKSSVETSACLPAADAAAQICDDRYISTYQLAHCNARPTSPPVNPPEFPRQRSELLCRTQGNFEIGVCDSSGTRSPIKFKLYPRNGRSSPDRGSLAPTQSSKGTEAFVNSLRKYPSVAPDKSHSSDLVLRLIAYTQAKNFSKSSYHSKSMRNLRNKRSIEQSKDTAKSKSRGVQTYTRTEKKTRDNAKESKSSAKKCTTSPDNRKSRHEDRQLSDTYDYLRSPSPRFSARATDVRYLSDVTRCLRDTLKQICNENTQVCPNIQNRYSRHRRKRHSDHTHLSTSSNDMAAQASVPLVSTGVPAFSFCEPMPGTYIQTSCCLCHKPLPCNCRPTSSAIQVDMLPKLSDTGIHPSQDSTEADSMPYLRDTSTHRPKDRPRSLAIQVDRLPNLRDTSIHLIQDKRKQADEDFKRKLEEQMPYMRDTGAYPPQDPTKRNQADIGFKSKMEEQMPYQRDTDGHPLQDLPTKRKQADEDFKRKLEEQMPYIKDTGANPPQDPTKRNQADIGLKRKMEEQMPYHRDTDAHPSQESTMHKQAGEDFKRKLEEQVPYLKHSGAHPPQHSTMRKQADEDIEKKMEEQMPYLRDTDAHSSQDPTKLKQADAGFKRKLEEQMPYLRDTDALPLQQMPHLKNTNANISQDATLRKQADKGFKRKLEKQMPYLTDTSANLTQQKLYQRDTGGHPSQDSTMHKQADEDIKRKLEEEVGAWLQEVPVCVNDIPENKAIRQNMVKDLIDKLKFLKRDDNFEDNAKNEVSECVDNLPMWYPRNKRDQDLFKRQIIDNLMNKIRNLTESPSKERRNSEKRDEYEKKISDWIKDIPELSTGSASDIRANQKLGAMLAENLNKIRARGINKDNEQQEMQNKINDWLESRHLNPIKKTELSKKLLQNLEETSKAPSKKKGKADDVDVLTKQIMEWLEDVPEVLESKSENQKLAEKLATKLQKSLNQDKDDSDIRDEISNWLTKAQECKGERLDSLTENDLVKNLFNNINTKSIKRNVETFSNEISGVFGDFPNIDISPSERKNLVDQMAKKMHELHFRTYDGDYSEAVNNEIVDWVNKLSKNTGVNLNSKDKEKLRHKLMTLIPGTLNRKKSWSKQEEFLSHAINDEISDIFERNTVSINEANKEAIRNKILALMNKNMDASTTVDDPNILTELFNILEEDARLPAKKAKQIADEILNKVKTMTLPRRSSKSEEASYVNAIIKEVGNILGNSDVYFDNADKVELTLSHVLADQAMRGESDKHTKARLLKVMKNSNLSDEESKNIASQLMRKSNELSSYRSEKDATHMFNESSRSLQTLPPLHKESFVDIAQKEILEFTEDLTNDSSASSTKKWKAAYHLAENIGDILSNPNTLSLDKNDLIKDKIVEYLEENDIQSGFNLEAQADKLVGKLKNLVFTTSTPRKLDATNSIYPNKYFENSSISTIGYDSYQRQQVPTNVEVQYTSHLVNKIDSWMKTLPINMNSEKSKGLKETMIRDLAGDFIDRQKYLQLNPTVKTSDEEELEHLKYQVFRWLNKLPDGKQLMPFLANTNELMESIKAVPVPQLTKENKFRDSFQGPDLSSMAAQISKWIEAVPSHHYTSTDKNHQQQMIRELAENIQNSQKNNTLTEPVLDDIIMEWLQEILNDSKQSLFDLSEGLKALLTNRGMILCVQDIQLKRKTSRKLNEDIYSHILGWLKEKSLNLRRNSLEKREQEQIITHLTKVIKDAAASDTNILKKDTSLLEKIKSHIQRLLLNASHLQIDDKFLHDTANELLGYLKESKVFRDILASKSQMSQTKLTDIKPGFKAAADILYDNIESWCNDLPIFSDYTPEEREKIKIVKQNIASKLINKIGNLNLNPEIFNDDSLYEDLLKDKIDDLLSFLPQTDELRKKTAALKDSLIEKVREANQKTKSELEGHAYKQQLCDVISTTLPSVTNLTMDQQLPFELLKCNLADAFLNLHYTPDNIQLKNKLKKKILDEINKFCNGYLKRFPASPVDATKLNQQLYTALQKVPTPKGETIKAQVEQVRIKDVIHEWLKNIPIKDDSPAQQIQKNKIVSVLAKLLHETEEEKAINPDVDVEDIMRKDITKWIKKLSLKPGAESKIDKEVKELIDRLKSTKEKRRFSMSNIKSTNDRGPITNTRNDRLKTQKSYEDKLSQCQHLLPPSGLCLEDRAHLERIRQRVQRPFQLSPEENKSKDAYVNPIPVDESSQTEIGLQNGQPLSPNVVINEYDWNSTDASRIQESYNGVKPNVLGHSYPKMPQQMSPQNFPSQQQSMSWPQPSTQKSMRTGATPQNQYGLKPQTSSIPPPPSCTMSRRLCMPSPPCSSPLILCAPPRPPCAPPRLPHVPRTRPCIPSSPPRVAPAPPCASSPPPCARPSPTCAGPTTPCAPPPCMFEPPCTTPTSSMRQMRSFPSRVPPSPSREVSSGLSRRWAPKQPQPLNSPDISSTSSPLDEYPEGGTSDTGREPPRVTRLGSLDDVPRRPFTRTCGSQSPRSKTIRESPCEDFKWSMRYPGDFWGTPCAKRRPCRMPYKSVDESYIKERKEEIVRCRCKERVLTQGKSRKPHADHYPCRRTDSMQRCSKCCGEYCPHPSYLFFR